MKLYRVSEAADITGLSLATWRSWILHRRVGVVRLGRSVRIAQEELDRIVREGTTPARRAETGYSRRRGMVPAA
jgi:excisionase family DNA binding protein